MPAPGRLVTFVAATDLDRAERFYTQVVGLSTASKDPYGLVLDSDGSEIRVNLVENKAEAPYTVLGWAVDDLTSTGADLRARGVAFTDYPGLDQDADGAWTAPDGTRVAWFADPDGNVLSLHQL